MPSIALLTRSRRVLYLTTVLVPVLSPATKQQRLRLLHVLTTLVRPPHRPSLTVPVHRTDVAYRRHMGLDNLDRVNPFPLHSCSFISDLGL